VFRVWELLLLVTLAWHIGSPMEILWHATKHIGRPYNVNDHRLNTRSVRVSGFIKLIFWGLDDHVDHHLYPVVPSRNLPKLHKLLEKELPDPDNVFGCWAEMFEIAKEKDLDPKREFLSVEVRPTG
jgi:fatty acid desaturase